MLKKIFDNKIINIVTVIVEWGICIFLIMLILLTLFQRFSNQGDLFGYRIYTVASGSMIPTYEIGDILLINKVPAEELVVGDDVTYIGEGYGVNGKIITHQIQEIEKDEEGNMLFHTKGIANKIEDPIVYENQILGKVVYKFLILGFLCKLTTNVSLMFVFMVLIAILVAIEIIKLVYKNNDIKSDEEDSVSDEKNDII